MPTHPRANSISRQQFQVVGHLSGVRLTALSPINPTKVVVAGPNGSASRVVMLTSGQEELLQPGDKAYFLATDPATAVTVLDAGGSTAAREESAAAREENAANREREAEERLAVPRDPKRQRVGPAVAAMLADADAGAAPAAATDQSPPGAAVGQSQSGAPRADQQQAQTEGPPRADQQQAQTDGPRREQQQRPVMLVLVGVPGSGKSTFANALLQRSAQRWARVNQDSIAGGGRGTRKQCLAAARTALQQGASVVVDRTNVTAEQRSQFLMLARELGADAHCLVLGLPVKACQARAAARTDHEGGLQGGRAFSVAGMSHKALTAAGAPKEAEGFRSVVVCSSDAEADEMLRLWAAYGPGSPLPRAGWEPARPGTQAGHGEGLQTLDTFFQRKLAKVQAAGDTTRSNGSGAEHAAGMAGTSDAGSQQAQQADAQAVAARPSGAQQGEVSQPPNAFQVLMSAAKHPPPATPAGRPKVAAHGSTAGGSRHAFPPGPFVNALVALADQPERHPGSVLHADGSCVLVTDKYPKARAHALVVARDARLQGPLDLSGPQDAALVMHMKQVGQRWAAEQQQRAAAEGRGGGSNGLGPFALGFHSVPSMRRLHMHVVSRDLDSPSLKNKKHWNSFTTPFFLGVDEVLAELGAGGRLQYDVEAKGALLKGGMRCHRCSAQLPNMPGLKAHLAACAAPLA